MPFSSKKQMAYMYSQKPELAKEFASKTKNFANLPEKSLKPKSTYLKMTKGNK